MRQATIWPTLSAICILLAACTTLAPQPADNGAATAYEEMIGAEDWRAANAAAEQLKSFGDEALPLLRRGAERETDEGVRRRCYVVLLDAFPTNEEALRTIEHDGLADSSPHIRYICAFHLGEHEVYGSVRRLQKLLVDPDVDEMTRFAAAKSLAELGEADGLPLIYHGLGRDEYMVRYLSNLGLAGLTGKDLNDFDYDFREGAFVSSSVELAMAVRPIEDAEQRAARFRAIAAYCCWLRDEHPAPYKHLEGTFQ